MLLKFTIFFSSRFFLLFISLVNDKRKSNYFGFLSVHRLHDIFFSACDIILRFCGCNHARINSSFSFFFSVLAKHRQKIYSNIRFNFFFGCVWTLYFLYPSCNVKLRLVFLSYQNLTFLSSFFFLPAFYDNQFFITKTLSYDHFIPKILPCFFLCLHYNETKSRLTKTITLLPDFTAMSNICWIHAQKKLHWKRGTGSVIEIKGENFRFTFLHPCQVDKQKAICYR